ncbi:MAG TPA: DUF4230 domain-containing protein [Micromonosporaceae bacterium]
MTTSGDVNDTTREFPEYPRGRATAQQPRTDETEPVEQVEGGGDGGRRFGRSLVWLAAIVGLIAVLVLGTRAIGLWPDFRNPFAQQQTDRSQPPLLKSIRDLSRFTAAEGNFEIVIDLQKNRKYVPDFLLNDRTLFVAAGTVESYVDFSTISEGAIVVSADGKSVEVRLPAPQLTDARLDLDRSYVFAEQRGLLNRLGEVFSGNPNRQQETYKLAQDRIEAAARDSGLNQRAEENTRKMLEGLLRSLGYTTVTVTFVAA